MSTAIDRIKSALEACPHDRGANGTKRRIKVGGREVVATHNPLVEVAASDLAELSRGVIGPLVAERERQDAEQHQQWDAEDAQVTARHEQEIQACPAAGIDALLARHVAERKTAGEARAKGRELVRQQRIKENLVSGKRIPMDLHMGASEIIEFGRQGQTVHIHVDDAWHLVDAADAAELAAGALAKKTTP